MASLTRRNLLGLGMGAAAAAILPLPTLAQSSATSAASPRAGPDSYFDSVANAVRFLDFMMDAYATGSTVRLTESYSDNGLLSSAFTYDNSVAIQAYLLRGDSDSLFRARVLGDGLIHAQANNFPFNDGRFAQAYFVNKPDSSGAYITPAASPFFFYTSAVGDQAWAGMALVQLYRRTGESKYLTAALNVANWIVTNTYNTLGAGGYSFGTNINQFNQSVPSPNGKSTEHNIDTYAFFTMLAKLTHDATANNGKKWSSLAAHALNFVIAMYNSTDGYFFTGTLGDQVSINYSPVPEDVQTWSYLAFLDKRYKQTIDWAVANLQTADTASAHDSSLTGSESFTGMVFDTASLNTTVYDPHAVWLEGTAHTVSALIARVRAGQDSAFTFLRDIETIIDFLANSRKAQSELGVGQTVNGTPIPAGTGLVASTSVMDTGFGYTYGPSLHIGATGWYILAALGGNPFQLAG